MKPLLIDKNRCLKPPVFLFFFILLGSLAIRGYSQQVKIESVVISNKGKGIPYAHVRVKGTRKGTISNAAGRFSIIVNKTDTIIISSVGFFSKEILAGDILVSIQLDESITALPEVEVTVFEKKAKPKKIIKGYNEKVIGQYGGPQEVALFIPNQEKIFAKILGVKFRLSRIRFDHSEPEKHHVLKNKELLVGLNIYTTLDTHNHPNLMERQLTLRLKKKQRLVEFDVSDLNILFPKSGVYVAIELLGIYEEDLFIPFNELSRRQKNQFSPLYSRNHLMPYTYVKFSVGENLTLDPTKYGKGFANANFQMELEVY